MIDQATISTIKQNITPVQAQEVLAAGCMHISEKEAEAVVNFLYTLAGTTLKND